MRRLVVHVGRIWLACVVLAAGPARAQDGPVPSRHPTTTTGGFWDGQFTGALGVGLGASLPTPVQARIRLGGGYAHEPWIVNLGVTFGVGGLDKLSLGAAAELNHFDGPFLELGAAYAWHDRPLLHATLGYLVFGLQYEHLLADVQPRHALLAVLRIPVGIWWFLVGRDRDAGQTQQADRSSRAARAGAGAGPPDPVDGANPTSPLPDPVHARARAARAQAERARAAGDLSTAERAYAEAVALLDEPHSRVALAEVRVAEGKLVAAAADLRAALSLARGTWEARRVQALEARYLTVFGRLAQLRVRLPDTVDEVQVRVDGQPAQRLLRGYDLPLDPGPHHVSIEPVDAPAVERRFEAAEGEIIRIAMPR